MALFRRKAPSHAVPPDPGPASATADFWTWWQGTGCVTTAAALAEQDPTRIAEELTSQIHAIDPALAWELAPGHAATYLLVVSPEGDPERRALARRWLRAAPPADEVWEYADARQPVADLSGIRLSFNGHEIAFGDVVITARRVGYRFDVSVHHPLFAEIPAEARMQIGFLALDDAIGEREVETWLGDITASEVRPLDAFPLEHLRSLVAALAAEARDENGQPTWVMMHGDRPEGPVLALAQVPLAATFAPELDVHIKLTVPFAPATADGFPTDAALQQLRDFEDHLCTRLDTGGRLVAHETCAGQRVLHFYVDSTGPSAGVLEAASAGWPDGQVLLSAESDPAWRSVHHLRA